MTKMDKFDMKLLAVLEEDARQTSSKIAKRLNTSQQVVSYRIKSLEKRKVIIGYYPIINITKLGYTSYRTMFRLNDTDKKTHSEIVKYLKENSNVLWFVDCGGRWDLIVNFIARNILHYSALLRDFRNSFKGLVQNPDVLTTIEMIHLGREYLTKKKREIMEPPHFGREEEKILPDLTNLKILKILSKDARTNSVQISQELGIRPSTVMLRIKDMKKSGIIQGFRAQLNLENTPYKGYKAVVKFQNITEEVEHDIIGYLNQDVRVYAIIRIIGLWDFEIEFEVENNEQMLELTRSFRDKFKEHIKEFEVIPLFHEYRYNFFPGDLLENNAKL